MPENILKMIVLGKRKVLQRQNRKNSFNKIIMVEMSGSLEMLHFLYFPSLVQFERTCVVQRSLCMHFKIGKLLHLSSFNSFLILILLCTTCTWLPVLCICKYRQYQFVNSVSNFYNYVTLSYP